MAGLVTIADPRDLPEGASPRCWDVDFNVGSVFSRPGLVSQYSYATTLSITGFLLSYGVATFTYVGVEPTVNEGFLLSGFTGAISYLNGMEVFVEGANITTFTVLLNHVDEPQYTGLTAHAVSTTGLFVGPSLGSVATSSTWNSPNSLFSTVTYASAATSVATSLSVVPPSVTTSGSGIAWTNPDNLTTTGASFATTSITTSSSRRINGHPNFSLPTDAVISGVSVTFSAKTASGSALISVQLASDDSTLIGANQLQTIDSSDTSYTLGSSSYQWGTTLTSNILNGANFNAAIIAYSVHTGSTNVSVNSLVVTVYYISGNISDEIKCQGFSFSLSPTTGVTGFNVAFKAYSSASTSVSVRMLKNGIPVGVAKTLALSTSPKIYNMGGPRDLWGDVWSANNVNSTLFGVEIISSGQGTTFVNDLDTIVYVTPALSNFNWIGSYEQNNNALTTLALDASGNLWKENVSSNPGVLSLALTGLLPNSFAKGATMNNSEFVMFSDLHIGTDRPRQMYSDGNLYPVTQVGPAAAPYFQGSTGAIGGVIVLSSYSITSGVATFQYTPPGAIPNAGDILVLNITVGSTFLNKQVVTVLASGLSSTQFESNITTGSPTSGNITGTATPAFSYPISAIALKYPTGNVIAAGLWILQSSGPGTTSAGTNVIVGYSVAHGTIDPSLQSAVKSGLPIYVEIKGAIKSGHNFNGLWLVTSQGLGNMPGYSSSPVQFFQFTIPNSGQFFDNISGSTWRITQAQLTLASPIPSLTEGTPVTITGATPAGWNDTWIINKALISGAFNITSSQLYFDVATSQTLAVYGWSSSPSVPPVIGKTIEIINCLNSYVGATSSPFNGTFVIDRVGPYTYGGTFAGVILTSSQFSVVGVNSPSAIASASEAPNGQATEFGTQFLFDPGETYQGTTTDVLFANSTTGNIQIIGQTIVPVGAGTRQAMCFFILETGAWTPASLPRTFTLTSDVNEILVSKLPIGPSNVVGRGVAITEAGANGVPGANFYVIPQDVTSTVGTKTTKYTSTIINDNTTDNTVFSFTDAVLLNSLEVDVQGNNLFNLIELGSCGWCIPYSSRMFYGLQLNKVDNFNNLSFDGGYYTNPGGDILPLGWKPSLTATELTLVTSPVTGSALYISNTTGSVQSTMGMIFQTAYQDSYNVAIISPNTAYAVRVACSCPSGIQLGSLDLDLVDFNNDLFGTSYGTFSVPLTSMGTTVSVFSGDLLLKGVIAGVVPSDLQFRVQVTNMGIGADVLIDRIEVYPTTFPYLKTEVYGSYIGKPEAVDASGDGGILDTSVHNAQACMGAFVLRDSLYLAKTNSLYVTRDNPNSEPGGWSITEVSSRVGSIGINSYDTGDEWAVMACRSGIWGFSGAAPKRLTGEIYQIWDAINWDYGQTIVLRNDNTNRRLYCAVPLPTGTSPAGVATASVQWLPYAPYNPSPTTPNVVLMLNYQALNTIEELFDDAEIHTTMFGTLAVQDMRRKWTIWNIATPYMGTVIRQNTNDRPVFFCNGNASSKIYELDSTQHDDDGVAIYSLYVSYGFVNAAKAVTMPLFGLHAKRYTVLQLTTEGSGVETLKIYPNTLNARYPYTVPVGITLSSTAQDDYMRSINMKGNRAFVEVSTNALGNWFALHKMLLTGKADPWSSINPTGGGSTGIV